MSYLRPRFSALHAMLIVLALSGGYAVAQDIGGLSHRRPAPPPPAQVVRQLGLSGEQASKVHTVLEHEQQLRQQFRAAIMSDRVQLRQSLNSQQLRQLRQIERQGLPRPPQL